MPLFDISVKEITLDLSKYTKTFKEVVQREIRLAAREWLAAVIPSIPVYSGASRGAFLPLGRFLQQTIAITPTENALKRKWRSDQVHGEDQGAALGSFGFNITDDGLFTFEFSSQVPQFLTNEFSVGLGSPPLIHPTPYHSLDLGNVAFKAYLLTYLKKKVPKVKDFITIGGINQP